ncbi:uncharacterized protein LOC134744785 [Cydia strobilella]|uniref:uncharacterized protein LOC134744785 n=1 Tax=Cydia strobilella TaxID=1100964 RepID=UPI00300534D7
MDTRRWSLSTCGECDFVLEPPGRSGKELERQKPCLGIDKLIQEERENQEWNVAFQKALVKRLEASERRLTLDDYLDDDDDDDSPSSKGGRKRKRKKEAQTTAKPAVKTEQVAAKFPEAQEVFKEKKCRCSRKIRSEERKRTKFVKIMEREQRKFERRSIRAQEKYEKDRQKAYKKCENTQLAMEKGYFKRNKDGVVDKAEETFSVFIHMDPAECGCHGRDRCATKCKKCFFVFCVWFYIFGFIIFAIVTYVLTWL